MAGKVKAAQQRLTLKVLNVKLNRIERRSRKSRALETFAAKQLIAITERAMRRLEACEISMTDLAMRLRTAEEALRSIRNLMTGELRRPVFTEEIDALGKGSGHSS